MRFLIDQPVSPLLAAWLNERGHDAVHVRERTMSAATDSQILSVAIAEGRIVVTADLDFSRLIALSGKDQPGLILFRAGNVSDSQMLELLNRVMTEVPAETMSAAVVVVDETTIRIARLPIQDR